MAAVAERWCRVNLSQALGASFVSKRRPVLRAAGQKTPCASAEAKGELVGAQGATNRARVVDRRGSDAD
jgi:hypothetical protein